jgi:ABC-type amino acid transport substrate-binding protein
MILGVTRRIAAAGILTAAAGLLATMLAAGAAGAGQPRPPHRQIGAAELSGFKVVLTVTRGRGQPPMATMTAAGYRRSGAGWKLIAVKRIGAPGQWFWFAVQACSLDITEFRGVSPVRPVDSVKVSLMPTQALGCITPISEHWKP